MNSTGKGCTDLRHVESSELSQRYRQKFERDYLASVSLEEGDLKIVRVTEHGEKS